jgi:hypothetical protein
VNIGQFSVFFGIFRCQNGLRRQFSHKKRIKNRPWRANFREIRYFLSFFFPQYLAARQICGARDMGLVNFSDISDEFGA